MTDPQFFGYGSLVNLKTHDYADPRPATLRGWIRVWQQSSERNVAFLSVLPAPGKEIDGVIARVQGGDWAALDAREHAYDRKDVTEALGQNITTAIYQGSRAKIAEGPATRPILLSYIDVVVQGFLDQFGTDGVQRFFDSTERWDTPVLNDRRNPVYPRHLILKPKETAIVDYHLSRLSAVVKEAM